MSLSSNINALAQALGADYKGLDTRLDALEAGGTGGGTDLGWTVLDSSMSQATIQAALDTATLASPKRFYFRAGTYTLSGAPLTVPFAPGSVFLGAGMELTRFLQTTAGQPVWAFTEPNTNTIDFGGMFLDYPSLQTNAGSIGIRFGDDVEDQLGTYHLHVHDVMIRYAYDGIAVREGVGKQTVWNAVFERIQFINMYRSAIRMAPSTAIGMPNQVYRDIGVFNTGNGWNVSTGSMFVFSACEVMMEGLDLEGWHNVVFENYGGGYLTIRGLHIEHHRASAASTSVFYCANGPVTVDGFSYSGASTAGNAGGFFYFSHVLATSKQEFKNGTVYVDVSLGSGVRRFSTPPEYLSPDQWAYCWTSVTTTKTGTWVEGMAPPDATGGGSSGSGEGARIFSNANTSCANNVDVTIPLKGVTFADAGFHNATNGTVTIPTGKGGRYLVTGSWMLASGNGTGAREIVVKVNGVEAVRQIHPGGAYSTPMLTDVLNLAAGDVVTLWGKQVSGAADSFWASTAYTHMAVAKL